MKQIKNLSLWMAFLMMLPLVSACGDDDEPNLDSYILGTWHSYKAKAYYMGETISMPIDRTGAMSSVYWEMTFRKGGSMTLGYWISETFNTWGEVDCRYSINNDIVTITDSDGKTISMVYKDKSLCLQATTTYEGDPMKVNVYLKK